ALKEIFTQFSHPEVHLTDFELIIKKTIDCYLIYSRLDERDVIQEIFSEIHAVLESGDVKALKGASLDIYKAIIEQNRPALRKFLLTVDAWCHATETENLVVPMLCILIPNNTVDAEQMLLDVCSDDLFDTDWILVQGEDSLLVPLYQRIPKEGANDLWFLISEPGSKRSTGAIRRTRDATIPFNLLDQQSIASERVAMFYDKYPSGSREIITTREILSKLKADPAVRQTRFKALRENFPIDRTKLKNASIIRRLEEREAMRKKDLATLEDPEESAILYRLIERFPKSMAPARFPRISSRGGWPVCGYLIKNHHVQGLSFETIVFPDWESLTAFSRLQQLRISILNDQPFPEKIFALRSLSALSISLPPNMEIPDKFNNLPRLTYLDISQRKASRLPESIGKLKNIEVFIFNGFDIESLPDWFRDLTKLKYLEFFGARISELPDYFKYIPLRRLTIIGAGNFQRIPEILGEMPLLYEFDWDIDDARFEEIYNNSSEKMRSWWDRIQKRLRKRNPEEYC
nr:hypothetical protein [Candidatus Sigynarchaeota archaeon]